MGMPASSMKGTSQVGPIVTTSGRGSCSATMTTTMKATQMSDARKERRWSGVRPEVPGGIGMRRT